MQDIERFIRGFRSFQKDYFGAEQSRFDTLKHGQNPTTMVIACSDSRVDPAILTNSEPGDIFTVRNVANLVPPYEPDGGQHGVSAALEFAVCHLGVEHIIVLGHSSCGGIKALMHGGSHVCEGGGFIERWMSIAEPARERITAELPDKGPALQQTALEEAGILLSLENLRSFPFVAKRVDEGSLALHGWYFDIGAGELKAYQPDEGVFAAM